jgi:hypothetical protein
MHMIRKGQLIGPATLTPAQQFYSLAKATARLTASLRCASKLQPLSCRRSDERSTGRRQVAKQQRFLG